MYLPNRQGVGELLFRELLGHPVMARHELQYLIGALNKCRLSNTLISQPSWFVTNRLEKGKH